MTKAEGKYTGPITTPYRDVLPPLSTEDREGLRIAIKAEGVRDTCVCTEDGRLLDGHHRRAIDPTAPVIAIPGSRDWSDAHCRAFIYRTNRRRNLSLDKKKELRKQEKATARELREEDAKFWTQEALAVLFGVTQKCVSEWLAEDIPNIPSSNGNNRTAAQERPDARTKLNRAAQDEIIRRVEAGESQAQVAADFDVQQPAVSKLIKRRAAGEAKRAAAAAGSELITDAAAFHHGDFFEVARAIPDASIQLVFTDPPYHTDALPLYRRLAEVAARVLVDGGSLITYCGHRLLLKAGGQMEAGGLTYCWPLACIHSGRKARMWKTGQIVGWKPMLWFTRGPQRLDPSVLVEDSIVSSPAKDAHPWQQGIPEALYYIERLTLAGGTVFDPFCGGGTTAAAARRCGRKVITCDVDADVLAEARGRYEEMAAGG